MQLTFFRFHSFLSWFLWFFFLQLNLLHALHVMNLDPVRSIRPKSGIPGLLFLFPFPPHPHPHPLPSSQTGSGFLTHPHSSLLNPSNPIRPEINPRIRVSGSVGPLHTKAFPPSPSPHLDYTGLGSSIRQPHPHHTPITNPISPKPGSGRINLIQSHRNRPNLNPQPATFQQPIIPKRIKWDTLFLSFTSPHYAFPSYNEKKMVIHYSPDPI